MKNVTILLAASLILSILSFSAFAGIKTVSPTQDALNISEHPTIVITFDSRLTPGNYDLASIKIRGSQSGNHSFRAELSTNQDSLKITPDINFLPGEVVTVTLTKSFYPDEYTNGYQWQFWIRTESTTGEFTLKQKIAIADGDITSSEPFISDIVTGDIDNDGSLEIVVAHGKSARISILKLANGDFSVQQQIMLRQKPTSVSIGDFDNDAYLDIAVCYGLGVAAESKVSIFFNDGNIPPSFTETDLGFKDIPFSGYPPMTAGDFDGDGNLDLALVYDDQSNNFSPKGVILKNNGDRLFSVGGNYNFYQSISTNNLFSAMSTGDWDGDGILDLLIVGRKQEVQHVVPGCSHPEGGDRYGGRLFVMTNNGSGSFGIHKFIDPVVDGSNDIFENPHSISLGDLDGNEQLDCVVGNSGWDGGCEKVAVVYNRRGQDPEVVQESWHAGTRPLHQILGDFNGDGSLEIVVANDQYYISMLHRMNDTYSYQDYNTLNINPHIPIAGDWNGDGRIDLAVSGRDTVYILLNELFSVCSRYTNQDCCWDLIVETGSNRIYSIEAKSLDNATINNTEVPPGWQANPTPPYQNPVRSVVWSTVNGSPLSNGRTVIPNVCLNNNNTTSGQRLEMKWIDNAGNIVFTDTLILLCPCKAESHGSGTRHYFDICIDWPHFEKKLPPWPPLEPPPKLLSVLDTLPIDLRIQLPELFIKTLVLKFDKIPQNIQKKISIKGNAEWLENDRLEVRSGSIIISGIPINLKNPLTITPIIELAPVKAKDLLSRKHLDSETTKRILMETIFNSEVINTLEIDFRLIECVDLWWTPPGR